MNKKCLGCGSVLQHIDPDGDGVRNEGGNLNINISNNITEIYFIGNSQATFTGVSLVPCLFNNGQDLNLKFKDFKFKGTSNAFFKGMGSSFGDIITLMAAAAVFTAGMSSVGLTNALLEIMKNSSSVASLGATFGPFALAMATGSGNAAIAAFNEALVPFAADFGFTQEALGAVALIAGGIGRSCSPVAGVTIIVARIAKVEPMDAAKYGILPCLVSALILMFTLL